MRKYMRGMYSVKNSQHIGFPHQSKRVPDINCPPKMKINENKNESVKNGSPKPKRPSKAKGVLEIFKSQRERELVQKSAV